MNNVDYVFYVYCREDLPRQLRLALCDLVVAGGPILRERVIEFVDSLLFLWDLGFEELCLAICNRSEYVVVGERWASEIERLMAVCEDRDDTRRHLLAEMRRRHEELVSAVANGDMSSLRHLFAQFYLSWNPGGQ